MLDLGSGSGLDSFLAALAVGPSGSVIGVDMTPAQVEKAKRLAEELGTEEIGTVQFHEGRIEDPDLPDGSFDCVISNGVVSLVPDKARAFAAAARALRPGGRLAAADIVSSVELPETVTCDASLWAACIGGAMQQDSFLAALEAAGFRIEKVRPNEAYRFVSPRAVKATSKYGVTSISVLAVKE